MGTRPYIVRQGDFLSKIAAQLGMDPSRIWELSENDELRARRPNPEMLAPGDVLHVLRLGDLHPPTSRSRNRAF